MTLSAVGSMICVLSELEGAQEGEEKHDGTSVKSVLFFSPQISLFLFQFI